MKTIIRKFVATNEWKKLKARSQREKETEDGTEAKGAERRTH